MTIFDAPAIAPGFAVQRFHDATRGIHLILVHSDPGRAAVFAPERYMHAGLNAKAVRVTEIYEAACMKVDVVRKFMAETGAENVRVGAVCEAAADHAGPEARPPLRPSIAQGNL